MSVFLQDLLTDKSVGDKFCHIINLQVNNILIFYIDNLTVSDEKLFSDI